MSQRIEEQPGRADPPAVTDFERERLDWQRRLYAAEDLAARLLSEKNQLEQSLKHRIAELEAEVVRLRQRLDDQKQQIAAAQSAASREASSGARGEAHSDPFGHVIRQASKGKHARVRRQMRQHLLLMVMVGLLLALAAVLVWQGLKNRSEVRGDLGLFVPARGTRQSAGWSFKLNDSVRAEPAGLPELPVG